ncbi:hypothetical protein [Benzoatithermus flavus]|uniref:PH domain-containing protein n=1 Tax=Benzoatithermus flavus TaxID=3108223 RepID=A0ABU8XU01_9PROT
MNGIGRLLPLPAGSAQPGSRVAPAAEARGGVELRYGWQDRVRGLASAVLLVSCGTILLPAGWAEGDAWRLLAGGSALLLGARLLMLLPQLFAARPRLCIDAAGVHTAWGAVIAWPEIREVRVRHTALDDRLELRFAAGWLCVLASCWHCPLDELAAVIESRRRAFPSLPE